MPIVSQLYSTFFFLSQNNRGKFQLTLFYILCCKLENIRQDILQLFFKLSTDFSESESQRKNLEEKLEQSEAEKKGLKKQLGQNEAQKQDLKKELERTEAEKIELKKKLDPTEAQIKEQLKVLEQREMQLQQLVLVLFDFLFKVNEIWLYKFLM